MAGVPKTSSPFDCTFQRQPSVSNSLSDLNKINLQNQAPKATLSKTNEVLAQATEGAKSQTFRYARTRANNDKQRQIKDREDKMTEKG